jgi:hypothetical protein
MKSELNKWVGIGLMVLVTGCAHHRNREDPGGFGRVYTPQMPEFLVGPACVLLTNAAGYSARVTVQAEPVLLRQGILQGELLARGTKLLFAPRKGKSADKDAGASDFSFIWDAAKTSGFVLSEALQGYAPVSSSLCATNVVSGPNQAGIEEATVQTSDGTSVRFRLWRAPESKGAPARLASEGVSPPLALTLSKVRLEAPPAELFEPPNGFSKYPTAEALADELAARRHNLRRGPRPSYQMPSTPERY